MVSQVDRIRSAVRADPFSVVEGVLVVAVLGGLAVLLLTVAPAVPGGELASTGLDGALVVTVGPTIGLVVVLLLHAGYDAWRLVGSGGSVSEAPVGLARASWRVLETGAVLLYVLLAVLSIAFLSALPHQGGSGPFAIAVGGLGVLATVLLVVVVATRLVTTAVYRGIRSVVEDP